MNTEAQITKLVLVDDHPAIRGDLRRKIEQTNHMVVVGEATNARDAIELVQKTEPHVVLIDLSLKGDTCGVHLIAELKRAKGPLTLVYSAHSESERMHRARRAGASGYVCKDQDADEVICAVERVVRGEECFPEGDLDDTGELSPRETQVAILIAKGLVCEEIGEQLGIGVRTVHTYRGNINEKWGTKNAAEVAREVKIRGLDEVDWTTLVPPRSQSGLNQPKARSKETAGTAPQDLK